MNFGIIGLGYWGPNYLRIINELGINLLYCCDLEKKSFDRIKPSAKYTSDYHELLKDKKVDAVIVSTPPDTHFKIVRDCLITDKDVLVEKPLTLNSKEIVELVKISKNNILMVGHTYIFNPGIIKLKSLITKGSIGETLYGISFRLGLSPIRKSASALWDLATHDISIFIYLFGVPIEISCSGESYIQEGIEDYVNLTLKYKHKQNFSIYASWYCPEKIRKITLVGTKKMIVFDDIKKSEMIKIYERTLDLSQPYINTNIL